MGQRLAGAIGLLAFAICLVVGTVSGNDFSTVILRALGAMGVCVFVGLIVGAMAQKMLEENLKSAEEKPKKDAATPTGAGR